MIMCSLASTQFLEEAHLASELPIHPTGSPKTADKPIWNDGHAASSTLSGDSGTLPSVAANPSTSSLPPSASASVAANPSNPLLPQSAPQSPCPTPILPHSSPLPIPLNLPQDSAGTMPDLVDYIVPGAIVPEEFATPSAPPTNSRKRKKQKETSTALPPAKRPASRPTQASATRKGTRNAVTSQPNPVTDSRTTRTRSKSTNLPRANDTEAKSSRRSTRVCDSTPFNAYNT